MTPSGVAIDTGETSCRPVADLQPHQVGEALADHDGEVVAEVLQRAPVDRLVVVAAAQVAIAARACRAGLRSRRRAACAPGNRPGVMPRSSTPRTLSPATAITWPSAEAVAVATPGTALQPRQSGRASHRVRRGCPGRRAGR